MSNLTVKDILSTTGLSKSDIETILQTAEEFLPVALKERTSALLEGKIMAALFYEPSTRTRLSFETAMLRLGGRVITVVGMENSSLAKGETLHDTAKVVENYADIMVMRHPSPGSAKELADSASVPVINAGDGSSEHPTQALLDLFTIQKERGKIEGLTIALVGDLKFGRTVHSLSYLLANYKVRLMLVSPNALKMPKEVTDFLQTKGVEFEETEKLEDALQKADVVYATRVQRERFSDPNEYERLKDYYVLRKELIERYNPQLTIMHPLPRVGEIALDTDELPGAAYFRQVRNGVAVRMALLALLLGKA
jgi:aspartate carbamoyltransferase catalytic subunit